MNNSTELTTASEEELWQAYSEELDERRLEEKRMRREQEFAPKYKAGGDLDYYLNNEVYLSIVYEYIRHDAQHPGMKEIDCLIELRRLCEPSVRHYIDCSCPICR